MKTWFPFTQMAGFEPLEIVRGHGVWLWDAQGKRYLDGVSSLWVNVHGHSHPAILAALHQQLDVLQHSTLLGLSHPWAEELASALAEWLPSTLRHVFYSDSGSSAVEIALKMAFHFHRQHGTTRSQFAYLRSSYHGDTLGAVAVGGIDLFHEVYGPIVMQGHLAIEPNESGLAHLEEACSTGNIAALIVEPLIRGAAGMLTYEPSFLQRAREITQQHGALLIFDEVATGFGRTGTMFAMEQADVVPDIVCLAKGLTGGMLPLAGTVVSSMVHDSFLGQEQKKFYHGHTYTGNPLACVAALASLALFTEENTLANVSARAMQLETGLQKLVAAGRLANFRQLGLMVAASVPRGTAAAVCARCRDHGLILRHLDDVVTIVPPLCVSHEEMEHLLTALTAALEDN